MRPARNRVAVAALILFLVLFLAQGLFAAAGEIHGWVHDSQGRPVKNATVTVVGTDVKTLSNENGEFTLQVSGDAKVRLSIQGAGYYPATVNYDVTQPAALVEVVLTPKVVVTEDVVVIAPRLDVPVSANPAATAVVGADTFENLPRAVGADEALAAVPGVKVDNQANGERVHLSMRGQGILTERGIRGVEVLLDGLPLNDPSGFVPDLFDVDWAGVQQMDVVRGPVAFLYGGGSAGGVIDIHTREGSEGTHGGLWSSGGSNAFYKTRADLTGTGGGVAYSLAIARTAGDGYRQHSAFWGDNLNGKMSFNVGPKLRLNVIALGTGFFNQNAEGLNLDWLAQDRRMANPDALTFNEFQKTVRFTGGLTGQWTPSERQRVSFTFFTRRTRFDEPVPSSVNHRTSVAPGGSAQYDFDGGTGWLKHHFTGGMDLDGQFIQDTRHPNLGNAVEDPELLSDQGITQKRFGGFATERLGLGPNWTLLASVRVDSFGNSLTDHLGTGLSGERNFSRATGHVGVTWNPRQQIGMYASWGQGFLPPATEELVNNPVAFGGFNQMLVPATSQGAEVGVRGGVRNRVYYDAAFFRLDTSNDFERYRIASRPLETFYGNAGESRRYGLESSLKWLPVNRLTFSTAYTYSHFIYTKYDSLTYPGDLIGKWLPNSPRHQLFADVTAELPRSLFVALGTEAFSRAYVDPTNVPFINGYGLLNARISKSFQRGRTYGTISFNGTNLLAKQYIAFSEPDPDGNSYQPGPEREVFVGLQLRF